MSLRRSKRLRGIPADEAERQDWLGAIFDSEDLGPLLRDRLESLEDLSAFGRTCRCLRAHTQPILEDAHFAGRHPLPGYAGVLAVASGKVRTVKFVHERHGIGSAGLTTAASMGYVHILAYLQRLEYPMVMDVAMHAAMGGQLASLKWLHANRYPMGVNALRMAAWSGSPDCVTFLLDHADSLWRNEGVPAWLGQINYMPKVGREVLCVAAENGKVACMEVLCARGFEVATEVAERAAKKGQLASLRWLADRIDGWEPSVFARAIKNDHHECVAFCLQTARKAIDEDYLVNTAVLANSVSSLRVLLAEGCAFTAYHARATIYKGERKALMHAFADHGHEFSPEDLSSAVLLGEIEAVKTLREELGVEWESDILSRLIVHSHLPMFAYAFRNGAPRGANDMRTCCDRNRAHMLALYLEEGGEVPVYATILHAAMAGAANCGLRLCEHMGKRWALKQKRELLKLMQRCPGTLSRGFMKTVFGV